MFGRTETGPFGTVAYAPAVWEWDPVNLWVDRGASGPFTGGLIWFDEHRGKLLRLDSSSPPGPQPAYERLPSGAWASYPFQGFVSSWPNVGWHSKDVYRNRVYHAFNPGYLHDVYPARYEVHEPSCLVAGGPWLQSQTSRAWIGGINTVSVTSLLSPLAALAIGFGDQTYGGSPLPLSLGSIGMPGCTLNIDPHAFFAFQVAGTTGTLSIPIPMQQSLVGTMFFQQAFMSAPGANPLGVLASYSVLGTVGRQR